MLSFLLPLLGIGKHIKAGIAWLFKDISRLIIAALIAACVYLYIGKGVEAHRADRWAVASRGWQTAYNRMVTANQLATDAANKNAERVKAEYQEINDEAEKDYAVGLAANRANLERWKLQNRRSSARQSDSPAIPGMPAAPMPPTGEAQFLVTGRDLEIASDNYSQLVALIEWAENIGKVETVPVAESLTPP